MLTNEYERDIHNETEILTNYRKLNPSLSQNRRTSIGSFTVANLVYLATRSGDR